MSKGASQVDATFTAIIGWLAPILSTLVITGMTALINQRIKDRDRVADERHAETEEKRREEAEWRERIERYMSEQDKKLDALTDATQTTMRTSMLHYIEKYLTRGWITPEERSSLNDMHNKYAALNANGFINGYMRRIEQLPDREI